MSTQAVSLAQVDTEYSADCIEWCPFAGFQDLFVCGTYQVLEPSATSEPQVDNETDGTDQEVEQAEDSDDEVDTSDAPKKQTQRTGRLLLFQVDADSGSVQEVQRIDTPAILDAKWSPHLDSSSRPCLAVGDAKGHLTLYHLDTSSRRLEKGQAILMDEDTTLVLSLDFSHRLHPHIAPQIITSLSSGSLARLELGDSGEYEIADKWHAHDFEPWCATWDNWDLNTVWSGGDDLKLKRWDVRNTSSPTSVNKRFDAGVTTITSSPYTEHLIAVGSYDESIRIFDARSPLKPLRTIALGGGIWRARFHPDASRAGDLLVACMHDGFKVVRLDSSMVAKLEDASPTDEDESGCQIVSRFDGHSSLAYGADWSRLPGGTTLSLVATCSFYDHSMHVWRA